MSDGLNEKIAVMKKVAQQYYEKREKKLKDEIALKNQEISLLQTAVREFRASLEQKTKDIMVKLETSEKITKEKDDTIKTLQTEKSMLISKLKQFDEIEEKKRKTVDQGIQEERRKFNTTISSLTSDHRQTMKQAMEMFNEKITQLTRSNDGKLESMKRLTDELIRKKDEECEKKIADFVTNTTKKLKLLTMDYEAKLQDLEIQKTVADQDVEYKYETMFKQKFAELNAARLSAEKRNRDLEEIVSRHIAVIEQYKEKYTRLYQESQQTVKKLTTALIRQEQIISTEVVSREKTILDLKNNLNLVATECGKKLEEKERIISELQNSAK